MTSTDLRHEGRGDRRSVLGRPWRRQAVDGELAGRAQRLPRAPPPRRHHPHRAGLRARPRGPRRPGPPLGRALHRAPARRGDDPGPPGHGRHHPRRRAAARLGGGHPGHPRRGGGGLRLRGRADRRRRHQARPPPVRLEGGPAGRHAAQDARGDGQGHPGPAHQARRPAPQHADDRVAARGEAAPHRAGEPRRLRAARAPARHRRGEVAARGPRVRGAVPEAVRRDRADGVDTLARARGAVAPGHVAAARHARRPRHPGAGAGTRRSTTGRSTRRWSCGARSSTRCRTSSVCASSSTR